MGAENMKAKVWTKDGFVEVRNVEKIVVEDMHAELTVFYPWSAYFMRKNDGHVFVYLYPEEVEIHLYKWEGEGEKKIIIKWNEVNGR